MTTIPASHDQHDQPRDSTAGSAGEAVASPNTDRGLVIFVGTGPGDPELLTLMAVQSLADADAVILDSADLFTLLEPREG